jgi:molybdenum-dependent DNA-binding transcriptional regulator ModE
VKFAIEQGGSIRAASKLLGKSYTSIQWWLARNGYEVQRRAVLVRIKRKL